MHVYLEVSPTEFNWTYTQVSMHRIQAEYRSFEYLVLSKDAQASIVDLV